MKYILPENLSNSVIDSQLVWETHKNDAISYFLPVVCWESYCYKRR